MRQVIKLLAVLIAVLPWLHAGVSAWADDEDARSIELFTGDRPENVSAGRSPRPASLTAENITVVTSAEIAALNAHTLADILDTIPGIQLPFIRTPGTSYAFEVQGSDWNHVLVLIDNVPVNSIAENNVDISSIPAQVIERVEVVKGAASSSWGNALGGVVNVISKSPNPEARLSGEVSASLGESSTLDDRGELSGTSGRVGYYLAGGKLHSDGLLPNNHDDFANGYGKFQRELPHGGLVTLSTLYTRNVSGQGVFPGPAGDMFAEQTNRQSISTLSVSLHPSDRLLLEAALKYRNTDINIDWTMAGMGFHGITEESAAGANVNLAWRGDHQRISFGVDYEHAQAKVVPLNPMVSGFDKSADRVGVYLSDVITIGRLAFIPSVRHDHTGTGSELFSPSFGVTCSLTENSVLRGYTARGYSLYSLGLNDANQKVWTSQVGFESAEIPYLWVKGTFFNNDTWNIPARDETTGELVKRRQIKRGAEFEVRTLPVLSTSLSVGYTYINAEDADTHQTVPETPRRTLKMAATFDHPSLFRAIVTGNYIKWNHPLQLTSKDGFLVDLHLGKRVVLNDVELELFLSVRNLFNEKQYLTPNYVNVGRWAEAGFRCRF